MWTINECFVSTSWSDNPCYEPSTLSWSVSSVKLQITHHAGLLRLPQISDDEKMDSLKQLISNCVIFARAEWRDIVATSGIIEAASSLMLETSNPKMRTLCGSIIEILQQRGTEVGEANDWRTLLSPLVSLLFNKDDGISETGKQSLLKAADKNTQALHGLVELGLFDDAASAFDLAFPVIQLEPSQQSTVLPQRVLMNILEVVEKVIRVNAESGRKTKKLKRTAQRIKQMNPPRQIKSVISSIITNLEDEDDDQDDEKISDNSYKELEKKAIISEEKVHVLELKLIQADEKLHSAEQRLKESDERNKQIEPGNISSDFSEQERIREKNRADMAEQEKLREKTRAEVAELEFTRERNRADLLDLERIKEKNRADNQEKESKNYRKRAQNAEQERQKETNRAEVAYTQINRLNEEINRLQSLLSQKQGLNSTPPTQNQYQNDASPNQKSKAKLEQVIVKREFDSEPTQLNRSTTPNLRSSQSTSKYQSNSQPQSPENSQINIAPQPKSAKSSYRFPPEGSNTTHPFSDPNIQQVVTPPLAPINQGQVQQKGLTTVKSQNLLIPVVGMNPQVASNKSEAQLPLLQPVFIVPKRIAGKTEKNKFIHSNDNEKYCTIAIDPPISKGVVRLEVVYELNAGYGQCIGIADSSIQFNAHMGPWDQGNQDKTVRFWNYGKIEHVSNGLKGNGEYKDNQRVAIEVDMRSEPRKVYLYIDNAEQPNSVVGIPPEIRFWCCICAPSSAFTITKFLNLAQSSTRMTHGQRQWQYGREWKQN
ncbi:MAG: hypothetical protein EZS28_011703 [Streblomastix strix]|uniref:SPRY domain-containing protein n=1 Tax=Streblomastix strix TaxID=222440 RepID=A0A5J4WD31_9EUKA|nr:MAG: hypothetical protein EZS28_011703 [Streblomastix strix]